MLFFLFYKSFNILKNLFASKWPPLLVICIEKCMFGKKGAWKQCSFWTVFSKGLKHQKHIYLSCIYVKEKRSFFFSIFFSKNVDTQRLKSISVWYLLYNTLSNANHFSTRNCIPEMDNVWTTTKDHLISGCLVKHFAYPMSYLPKIALPSNAFWLLICTQFCILPFKNFNFFFRS